MILDLDINFAFGIIGFLFFGRIPVDSSHFSLHFKPMKSPQIFYFERFKAQFNPSVWTELAADSLEEIECSVLNITLLVGRPHFSTVLSLSRRYSTFPLSSGKTL